MFDRYVVVDDSLRNVTENGTTVGYAFDARIPYYRGLGLSMVEVDVVTDGHDVPRPNVAFSVHGNTYRSDQMDEIYDDRWGFTEPATITVNRPGGLPPGDHVVTLKVVLRVSYMPTASGAVDTKTLRVS